MVHYPLPRAIRNSTGEQPLLIRSISIRLGGTKIHFSFSLLSPERLEWMEWEYTENRTLRWGELMLLLIDNWPQRIISLGETEPMNTELLQK